MPKQNFHYVRSSDLYFHSVNPGKKRMLRDFLGEYRRVMSQLIDYYWDKHNLNGDWTREDLQTRGSWYPYPTSQVITHHSISAKAVKCAATQAMGMINAALRKKQKQMWQLARMQSRGDDPSSYKNLQKKIDTTPLVKPRVNKRVGAELNSIIANLQPGEQSFDLCLVFNSMFTREYKREHLDNASKFHFPINRHRRFNHWESRSIEVMKSFLITENRVTVRFICRRPQKTPTGKRAACDQGVRTLLSVVDSDGNRWGSSTCPAGHDLDSIIRKMERKQKGSKKYQQVQKHRTNYIKWCVNQFDLTPYDDFVLERLVNMGYKQRTSSYLRRFTSTEIRGKLQAVCEEEGVLLVQQDSAYRSQRCSSCGFVHVRNRSQKKFECRSCGHTDDADFNAAANHLAVLPSIKRNSVQGKNRSTGFFWN